MLHIYQSAPFSSPSRQQQFEAVVAALRAEAGAPYTLVLANITPDPSQPDLQLDAVVIRPRSLTILQLIAAGGLLHIPDLRASTWLLDGMPLELPSEAANPFALFEQQRTVLATWLAPHLPPEAANLQFTTGLVLFGAPVRFGPEVEARMAAVPAASTFHLLADPARFTRRLAQLATPEIDLTPADLEQLVHSLGIVAASPPAAAAPESDQPVAAEPARAGDLLRQKAGQLWRWLGAEDVDELDRRSTGYEVDLEARSQEKQELEQLRTSLQTDLSQQLRAMETRETEREQRIQQLQQQLAAAPVAAEAPDLQAQLATEKREKDALESSIQAYRTELENRNQELGSKIQQLENLIQRLSAAPTVVPPGSTAILPEPPALPKPTAEPTPAPEPPVVPLAAPAPPTPPVTAAPAAPSPTTTVPPTAPKPPITAPPRREQFGRPAEARQRLLAGLDRWRPALRQLTGRFGPWAAKVRQQPRQTLYAASAGIALLVAVGIVRCSSAGAPVPFQEQGRYGLLASNGDTLLPARYTTISEFKNHVAVVEQNGVFGFIRDDGTEVVKPAYDALYPYSDGYARARVGQLYTFLDATGQEFGAYYYAARDFAGGYAAVLDYRGWHYLTGPDEPASAPVIFQEAYSFEQELARVKTQNKFTFIGPEYLADTTAGTAPFGRYTSATDFDAQGRARVSQQGRTFFIDRDGDEVKE
ncbi:WG repeat-containing protein [Hymenobacter sp. 5516J-16]|uniref:WG repeat-containing protein n=1 Tax=Hymenobacter sp. 5516J-16 TaxID=2932253 RepID=UPI001FD36288|nr:WG repeat-containing protein [Hymenobacter sp. 5516J-16]UOQ78811.1 WG repeat-containing protein [Hymenobacter sp. 5516J-16]